MKEGIFALLTAAAISVTVVPQAASAVSPEVGEYLTRMATGTLYVRYDGEDKSVPESEAVPELPFFESEIEESPEESMGADLPEIPQGAVAVQAVNLSRLEVTETPRLLLANETKFTVNLDNLADKTQKIKSGAVLIIHTHGTEAYLPPNVEYYMEGEDFRSTDKKENVVAVGEEFAAVLRANGIEVYHDQTMYDEHSYTNAYAASRAACRQWLADHPEISYIIDIHRDAVGETQKPLCIIDGVKTAQVMLVIGTNEAGANHSGWQDNLSVGAKYQRHLNNYPTLARPVYLRRASYNQQLCKGSMLIEIGSAANTIDEAKEAAKLSAEAFCKLYNELK